MVISFRLRLFVVATLIVSTVLALVMGLGWSSVLSYEVQRLDERLCSEARRLGSETLRTEGLQRLEVDVMRKLRLDRPSQLKLQFEALGDARSAEPSSIEPRRERTPPGECFLSAVESEGTIWRTAIHHSPEGRSTVAADLAATKAELQGALRRALMIVVPLAVALSALGAWLLASLTMRPVNRLRDSMRAVTQMALDQRLASNGEDIEFRELITAYNTMLARLQASFLQASRFSADAAHELRTPLTILQGRLEQAVNMSDNRAVQAELSGLQDEVGRLSGITRKLLLLSQADAGRLALHLNAVDLSSMLGELLTDAEMLLDGQVLSCAIEPHLMTQGDALLLRQLFNNLISNAVRHCLPGGAIDVTACAAPDGVDVFFRNACEPIDAESRARFFDRFYRGEASHNRAVEGNGLGLSLAREIARAHGGELTLQSGAMDEVILRLHLSRC
jgi:signal transduction histidine kinase